MLILIIVTIPNTLLLAPNLTLLGYRLVYQALGVARSLASVDYNIPCLRGLQSGDVRTVFFGSSPTRQEPHMRECISVLTNVHRTLFSGYTLPFLASKHPKTARH